MLKKSSSVLPGFTLSLGLSVFYLSLIVLLPAATLVIQSSQIEWSHLIFVLSDPRLLASLKVTFQAAGLASLINCLVGLLLAWILVRYQFFGKRFLDTLIDLPFALPTAVAGLTLTALFAHNGWIGRWLKLIDVQIAYSFYGIILAMVFTSIPFVVRTLQPVLEDLAPEFEEAAESLGANKWQVFFSIIFPHIRPALIIGTALSFVRSLGEFGAVIFISGNMPYATEVVSLMVYTYIGEYNYPAAAVVAMILLLVSLLLLFFVQVVEAYYGRRVGVEKS